MIPVPTGVRVWIAAGHTDMRRGMNGLSAAGAGRAQAQSLCGRPIRVPGPARQSDQGLWHDGLGLSLYGQRSERTQRLLDQYEFQLEKLEASATADALAGEKAAAKAAMPALAERRKPSRQPFPAQLPRVRVVVPAPTACPCCGDTRLSKLGEDVTETLEAVPRQWTMIQTVRERFSCRTCESITRAPAPFHAIPRGWAGPRHLFPRVDVPLLQRCGGHAAGRHRSRRATSLQETQSYEEERPSWRIPE